MKYFVFFLLFWIVAAGSLKAYTDEIGVLPEEVWKAAKEMAGPGGIDREDREKWELVTKWKEDRVRRRRGLLKNYIHQTYDRRYKLKIHLEDKKLSTVVTITGTFEEKGFGAHRGTPWRSTDPEIEDLEVERRFFYKLLDQIKAQKQQSSSLPKPSGA